MPANLGAALRLAKTRLRGRAAFAAMHAHLARHFAGAQTLREVAPGIEVGRVEGAAGQGLATFLTRGLSRYPLPCEHQAKQRVAQEIALTVDAGCSLPVERALESIARMSLFQFRSLRPGMTYQYSFAEEFTDPQLSIAGFFASDRVWLDPEQLAVGRVGDVLVEIVELAPITDFELELVQAEPSEFVSRTLDGRIDLLDFRRRPKR